MAISWGIYPTFSDIPLSLLDFRRLDDPTKFLSEKEMRPTSATHRQCAFKTDMATQTIGEKHFLNEIGMNHVVKLSHMNMGQDSQPRKWMVTSNGLIWCVQNGMNDIDP